MLVMAAVVYVAPWGGGGYMRFKAAQLRARLETVIGKKMASEKDLPSQSEREKTDVSPDSGRVKTDEQRRDSDLDFEQQAKLKRDAERAEADTAKLQSRRDSDLSRERADMGRSRAQRQAERDKILRLEREIADEGTRAERLRADAATERERRRYHAAAKSSAKILSREQESHSKTKAALTTREELLAIVSHDLRNPLNNISLAAQNLLEGAAEPEDKKEFASSINRSVGEMLRLIEDLLDVRTNSRRQINTALRAA